MYLHPKIQAVSFQKRRKMFCFHNFQVLTRYRFQNVPVRVPFSKSTVFINYRQKMCRFRVHGRPIRHIFYRIQNVPTSCERSLILLENLAVELLHSSQTFSQANPFRKQALKVYTNIFTELEAMLINGYCILCLLYSQSTREKTGLIRNGIGFLHGIDPKSYSAFSRSIQGSWH